MRTQTLSLQCARYNATMKGIDANDFPIITTVDERWEAAMAVEGTTMELDPEGLRKMIDQVIFAASKDESRPTLTGVEVSFKGDRLLMAATDGYRLSMRSVLLDSAGWRRRDDGDCAGQELGRAGPNQRRCR